MRILFMGTPDFARVCLEAVYNSKEEIVGVVTAPDKPKGRGMVMTPSSVKVFAEEKNLSVYQPKTLKDGAFQSVLDELKPELIIVVAYGKILPPYVLNYPKYKCINAHASILPKYRGAAPIQRAIMNGEKKTGVSIMRLDDGIDTGDVILINEVDIDADDNYETVHDKLAAAGSKGLIEAIELFKKGEVVFKKQPAGFSYAEKIEKQDCLIDFSKSVNEVHNQIRGLSPIPLAFTKQSDGKFLKIVKAHITDEKSDGVSGKVVLLDKYIHVNCKDGVIAVEELVPEGKGKMSAKDYINGRKINIGDILG